MSALASHVINSSGDKLAYSFIARETDPITAVNVFLRGVGAPNCTLIISIQSDNAGAPSGTVLGATNNAKTAATAFAPGATYAFTGEWDLGESTGALTINARYWVTVEVAAATTLDGSNYYQTCSRGTGSAVRPNGEMCTYYDGASWASAGLYQCSFIVKRATGIYSGSATPQFYTFRATNNIWCDSDSAVDWRQGIRYKVGVQHYCIGIRIFADYVGTPPEGLIFDLFEGTTLKQSTVEIEPASAAYCDNVPAIYLFTTPVLLAANTNIYIIGRQATGTSGAAGNSYDIPCVDVSDNNYQQCFVDPDVGFAFVYGSGSDPTSFTVEDARYMPLMVPCITNLVDDLVSVAGGAGGGLPILGGSLVR